MRHGQKIYPSHHRIEMAVEIASLKCQHSSINQSSTRKNCDSTTGQLLWDLLMGIGNSSSNVVLTWKARCWYYFLWWEDHKVNWEQRGLSLLNLFNWKQTELNWKRAEPSDGLRLKQVCDAAGQWSLAAEFYYSQIDALAWGSWGVLDLHQATSGIAEWRYVMCGSVRESREGRRGGKQHISL